MMIESAIPQGALNEKWSIRQAEMKLVSPANKRRHKIIVVGAGLAGASAAASLAELGYQVDCYCFQDSPRRAHSVAAQGGINAAKNYRNDGDSVYRLFYDTIKGGDFRAREANVYRLAEISNQIIDHCVAQGVPFARDYGGNLDNRSFGGAQVSRTFYARGQTGQQLLLGAYGALSRQIHAGQVRMHSRTELLDIVCQDGRIQGIMTRHLLTGEIQRHSAHAVVLATGGYSNLFYLSTNAIGCNVTAIHRAYQRGAWFANPCFTQIHPTCIPASGDHQSKLTLMSESLRNDGRIWVPKQADDPRTANEIPHAERDYFLERRYPAFGNLTPRDIASRAVKQICDEGKGIGKTGYGVYLDLGDAISELGLETIKARYGNLFQMYQRITNDDPAHTPIQIYPAAHYTMGGLWVNYDLMSNIEGLFVIGEANFSDHGANRLGASALMQGLADGYFIVPKTISHYLAEQKPEMSDIQAPAFARVEEQVQARLGRLLSISGKQSADSFHRRLGQLMWDHCGMGRNAESLTQALQQIPLLREEFWADLNVKGGGECLNMNLEKAGRVADFLEFAELVCQDALQREESCGAHFRLEYQTDEGEARRNDERFDHVAIWHQSKAGAPPQRYEEKLNFQTLTPSDRNYK